MQLERERERINTSLAENVNKNAVVGTVWDEGKKIAINDRLLGNSVIFVLTTWSAVDGGPTKSINTRKKMNRKMTHIYSS